MTAKLIKGTEIREQILEEITAEVAEIKEKHGVVPGLVTILIGENPASMSYVTLKIKTAHRVGFHEIQDSQPIDIPENTLLALIDKYNNDDSINGILVQLPLPSHINEQIILDSIHPNKDADGLHTLNLGKLLKGEPGPRSCTPAGVMALLSSNQIEIEGKRIVVIDRKSVV